MIDKISLLHGDGGSYTNKLIRNVFLKYYGETETNMLSDSFVFSSAGERLAYTTDSFVVRPLMFKGGDIGKLSVCGTINDLATAGAIPIYLSAGFIIEEGFERDTLCHIAKSIGEVCKNTGVKLVTGDTKVVEKGCADGLYINTSGIGKVSDWYQPGSIETGDDIIITGTIAEHGTTILLERYNLAFSGEIFSDCAPMNQLIPVLGEALSCIRLMKDPTRGGLATVLNEISKNERKDMELEEGRIPIRQEIRGVNKVLGIDPLYLACEGRMVLVAKRGSAQRVLERIKTLDNCKNADIIGHVTDGTQGIVYIKTSIGGKRLVPELTGQSIPRIC